MKANTYQLKIPMLCSFGHAEKSRTESESLIFTVEYKGVVGIGECAPRKYVTGETIDSVASVLAKIDLDRIIAQIDFSSLKSAVKSIVQITDLFVATKKVTLNAQCAVELALFDLVGKYFGCSVATIIKDYLLTTSPVSRATFPTTQVLDFSLPVTEFLETRGPFHYIKIKVGTDLAVNKQRVKMMRARVGAEVPILLDANMAWDLEQAAVMVNALQPFGIDYFEEPLAKGSLKDYKKLRAKTGAKILLDESLCSYNDGLKAIKHQACDAFNIRVAKCGGLINSIRLIELAKQNEIGYQIGAQVAETGPLIAAARGLASVVDGYFTFEGGQPERFFDSKDYVVEPMPLVNRTTNLASAIDGDGLGISLISSRGRRKWQNMVQI